MTVQIICTSDGFLIQFIISYNLASYKTQLSLIVFLRSSLINSSNKVLCWHVKNMTKTDSSPMFIEKLICFVSKICVFTLNSESFEFGFIEYFVYIFVCMCLGCWSLTNYSNIIHTYPKLGSSLINLSFSLRLVYCAMSISLNCSRGQSKAPGVFVVFFNGLFTSGCCFTD